jgi:ABC-type uncharacterized transport system substrate-binding protein
MRRREFITLLGGAAAWPIAARAQQGGKVWRVGLLAGGSRPVALASSSYAGFARGMREFGYVEGKDFIIEWRFAEGRYELFPELAAELVRAKVDVIVLGTGLAVFPTQQATSTIPIVMVYSINPVASGYVASLARPGGNTTGLSAEDTTLKRLEIAVAMVPGLKYVGILANPDNPRHQDAINIARSGAEQTGIELVSLEARNPDELSHAFGRLTNTKVDALIVPSDPLFFGQRTRIAELSVRYRLPTVFADRDYVEAGGLVSYGEGLAEFFRRAASYVDKIFKGANPADLPVEQPTRFFLVINLRTAKALGLDVPGTLLARADEVIE